MLRDQVAQSSDVFAMDLLKDALGATMDAQGWLLTTALQAGEVMSLVGGGGNEAKGF